MDSSTQKIWIGVSLTPIIIITLFLLFVAAGIIMLVLLYQKRQLQYLKDKELLQASFQKESLESRLEIQEQTFKNISLELHDNIGQILSLAKLNLHTVDLNAKDKAEDKINDAKDLLGKAIQDIRDLSKTFNNDTVTNLGLAGAIELELKMLEKTGAIKTSFINDHATSKLDPQIELILFRVVQEAFHNIIKHAQASTIEVSSLRKDNRLELSIKDDGVGFDTAATGNSGNGLSNMRSRCKLINAECGIASVIGSGTNISINVPVLTEYQSAKTQD